MIDNSRNRIVVIAVFLGFIAGMLFTAGHAFGEVQLSEAENRYIHELQSEEGLTIAMRRDDIFSGELTEKFVKYFHLPMKIKYVKWYDYFNVNGCFPQKVRTDDTYVYTPDLMAEVDLYADVFTYYPWRARIFRMIKIFPVRTMAVTRKGEELKTVYDLAGKIIAVHPASTYYDTLREIETKLSIKFSYLFIDEFENSLKLISEGKADVILEDSSDGWRIVNESPDTGMSIPLSDVQWVCWMVGKDNEMLAAIIEKFVNELINSGEFDKIWMKAFKVPFEQYLEFIY